MMRYIKKVHLLYLLLAFVIGSTNEIKAQQLTLFSPYEGTWHYQEDNKLFVVSLWEDSEGYKGHYNMITIDSNDQELSVVYNSNKPFSTSGQNWAYVINTGFSSNNTIGGNITDNTITTISRGFFTKGITITIQPNNDPITAHWEVYRPEGIKLDNEPDFNIPTNVILTKVSNEVDLD